MSDQLWKDLQKHASDVVTKSDLAAAKKMASEIIGLISFCIGVLVLAIYCHEWVTTTLGVTVSSSTFTMAATRLVYLYSQSDAADRKIFRTAVQWIVSGFDDSQIHNSDKS